MGTIQTLSFLLTLWIISVHATGPNLQFTVTNSRLPTPSNGHKALYDGQDSIYIIGGQENVWKYSLSTETVSEVGKFLQLWEGAAALTNGGDILWFGGRGVANYSSSIYRWSPASGAYAEVASLPQPMIKLSIAWDEVAQVGYEFGGTPLSGAATRVLRYAASNNQLQMDQLATLPPGKLESAAVWEPESKVAYMFGGYGVDGGNDGGRSEIYMYTPATGALAKLNAIVPEYLRYHSAVLANAGQIYILGPYHLIQFDSTAPQKNATILNVDNYPQYFIDADSVYVPKLGRIYVFGGYGNFGDEYKTRDEIAYIDLGTATTLPPAPRPGGCSPGLTALIADPTCCESFYFCLGGVKTKYDCPEGQQFNPKISQCQDAAVVKCGVSYQN